MLYPFIFTFILLSIGIVLAKFLNYHIPIYLSILAILFSLLIKREFGLILFGLSLILFGYSITYKPDYKFKYLKNVDIVCQVNSIPKVYQNYLKFSCKVEEGNKLLNSKEVKAKIFSKEPYNLDIFYRTKLHLKGNIYVFNKNLYLKAKEFNILDQSDLFISIWHLKRYLLNRYREKTEDENLFALGSALIFGEKTFLSEDLRNVYIKSGLIHLLAISGLHVGMLILVLMLILYPLGKRLSYSIISAILTIYPIFTGLQPPVLRASLMGILVLIGKIKNFQINSLNILFFVGTLIIIVSPDMLFSPSFQLSFVAVLGIILGLNMFNFTGNSIWELIAGALWVSIVAMLFTSPIVMYYFGQLSPISIIATPIATIPLYPYIFLSVLNIISAFSFDILVDLMNKFGTIFLTISVFFSDLNIYFIGFAPKLFYVIIYILVLIILFIWDKNKLLRLGLIAISTVIFLALSYTKQTKEFEVYKIRRGYVVKFNQNKCLIYQSKYNPFVVNKLNKINCQERIFVFNPRKKEDIPSGFDKYVPLNQEFYGIKFLKVGRKILIKINDKFINKSQIKVLE